MKTIVKIIAVTVCALLILSLGACSKKADTAESAAATEAAATEAAAETTAETTAEAATAAETEASAETEAQSASPLVGSWDYAELSGFVYTFNEDGTGKYDAFGEVLNFTYTVTDSTLEFHYEDTDAPFTTEYTIDGDTLTIKDSLGEDVKYIKK